MSLSRPKFISLFSSILILFFVFSIYLPFASATIGDSMNAVFGSLKGVLEPTGKFIGWTFENAYVRNGVMSIISIIFFYAVFSAGLSKVPIFSEGDNAKKGKLVAISLAIASSLGIYYGIQANGGSVKVVLETFGQVGVLMMSFAFGSAIYMMMKELSPDARPTFKIGATLFAVGLVYYLFGKWIKADYADLGIGFIIIAIILMFLGRKKGINSTSHDFGTGLGSAIGSGINFFKNTRDAAKDKKRNRIQNNGVTAKIIDKNKHTNNLIMQIQIRLDHEKADRSAESEFLDKSIKFTDTLNQFVNFFPTHVEDLVAVLGDGKKDGFQKSIAEMLSTIGKKEIRASNKERKLNSKIIRSIKKIESDLNYDTKLIEKSKKELNSKKEYYTAEQKASAEKTLSSYEVLLNDLENSKIDLKKILMLEQKISILQKEILNSIKDKKTKLIEINEVIKNSKQDLAKLHKEKPKTAEEANLLKEKTNNHLQHLKEKMMDALAYFKKDVEEETDNFQKQNNFLNSLFNFKNELVLTLESADEDLKTADEEFEGIKTSIEEQSGQLDEINNQFDNYEDEFKKEIEIVKPILEKEVLDVEIDTPILNEEKNKLEQLLNNVEQLLQFKDADGNSLVAHDNYVSTSINRLKKRIIESIELIAKKLTPESSSNNGSTDEPIPDGETSMDEIIKNEPLSDEAKKAKEATEKVEDSVEDAGKSM